MAKKGDWVLIHKIVLSPEERAPQVPDDTKKVPLEIGLKAILMRMLKSEIKYQLLQELKE